jgi:hypothetical protein
VVFQTDRGVWKNSGYIFKPKGLNEIPERAKIRNVKRVV